MSVPDLLLSPETYNWYHIARTCLRSDAFMNGEGLSFFMGPGSITPVAICLQDITTSQQQLQQPDKVGTQITLLKTGCLEALLYLSTASTAIVRIQVHL